ncbi:DUF6701 domain-containing protein [Colwellia sp. E2M01]|uniref:DUF6701 domain-containing protein n=1 Tax=Colwellia sp. E2M01 TaxID=2841561 RepID=UPI001C088C56|nr:DUF6701 domain-containing protein [Colwellia sp. E2M01]MBU2870298.1 hypothetical protein [Colwellia sp. E2M01]
MTIRALFYYLLLILFSQSVRAVECPVVFPDGIQNNDDEGLITFNYHGQLKNSPDNILATNQDIIDASGDNWNSCEDGPCTKLGSIAEVVNINDFGTGEDGDITLIVNESQTIAPGNYGDLLLNYHSVLTLTEGDYYFTGNFVNNSQRNIIINGSGVVRIFVQGIVTLGYQSGLNENGSATQLLLYSADNIVVGNEVNFSGFIYSKENVTISYQSYVKGAISAKNLTPSNTEQVIEFEDDIPDFGDFCGTPSFIMPITDYRFDELVYTGAPGEIIDSITGADGQAIDSQPTEGKVCNAIDLSATGIDDYAILDESVLTGKTNFSISLWSKSSKTSNQSFLSGAGASANDLLMWFINDTNFRPHLKNSYQGDIRTPSIADGEWHHLVWTREGNQSCIFVDKVLQGCVTQSSSALSIQSLILGQEQDSIGGDFVSSQALEGLIDELLIFDEVISSSQVADIYDNQNSGRGYDGSARVCPTLVEAVTGRVTLNNTISNPEFTHVCFDTPFSSVPQVFSLPTTANDEDRLTLRIKNVTTEGFDIAQVESREQANSSPPTGNVAQTVDFLAIVEGDYNLDGGAVMRVGSVNTQSFQSKFINGSSWETVNTADLNFSQSPAIITAIQTMSNETNNHPAGPFPISEPFMATTVSSVTNTQFNIALDRGETTTGTVNTNETIGYIAITAGASGQLTTDITFESFLTNDNIQGTDDDNDCQIVNFNQSYDDTPLVIASKNSHDGPDGGWLKQCAISTSSVGLVIVEDADNDEENAHTTEIGGGLVLGGAFKDYTNSCPVLIDHFEIDTLNGQGLTCEPDTISIKACSNADCDLLYSNNVDVQLLVTSSSEGISNKMITVVGGESDFSYRHTVAEQVSLSIDKYYECSDGEAIPCTVTFADAGFRFVTDTGDSTLPLQLSGKPSNTGFNASTLQVEAVKTDDSGACAPLLVTGQSIEMAGSYQNPSTGSEKVNISGVDIGTAANNITFDNLPFSSVALDFGNATQNKAEFVFTYPDAGTTQLHARYELPDDNGNSSGEYVTGSSNPITVRPLGFFIDVADNPEAQSASDSVFKKAGEEFTTSVSAVAWHVDDDSNGDGVPDTNADLSNNNVTPNFGNESVADTVVISGSIYLPNPGTDGTLTNTEFTNFTNGVATNGSANNKSMTYSEVGIVSFSANLQDSKYLGGSDISGEEPYVGRFIPDHFAVKNVVDGILNGSCDTANTTDLPFVYSGQRLTDSSATGALGYLIAPKIVLEARNSNDQLTQNYTEDFIKLSLTNFERLMAASHTAPSTQILAPVADNSQMGKDATNLVRLTANIDEATLVGENGVITYSYNDDDNFFYWHEGNSEIAEFTSDIDLSMVSIIDGDLVETKDYDGDTGNNLILTLQPSGKLIRFGRAQLENSYGPDTSDLPQTLSVTYYTADGYILNEEDTCTIYNSSNISLTNISLDPEKTPIKSAVSGTFADEELHGETRDIILTAPTVDLNESNTGQVCVSYSIFPWLQYKWAVDEDNLQCSYTDVDGLFNDNPHAIATFGLYRGNDRIIYQREVSR